MTKLLYLAGPMSGIPKFNYPAFQEAAGVLRTRGFSVRNPAEMDSPEVQRASMKCETGTFAELYEKIGEPEHQCTWGDFLSEDVKLIADEVDAVALLPGWENSRGARLEAFVAYSVQKEVYLYEDEELKSLSPMEGLLLITHHTEGQGDVSRYNGG